MSGPAGRGRGRGRLTQASSPVVGHQKARYFTFSLIKLLLHLEIDTIWTEHYRASSESSDLSSGSERGPSPSPPRSPDIVLERGIGHVKVTNLVSLPTYCSNYFDIHHM